MGTASRKARKDSSTDGGVAPRCASETTTRARPSTAPKMIRSTPRRNRCDIASHPERLQPQEASDAPPRSLGDSGPRELLRDRSNGGRVPRPLPRLARRRPDRAPPAERNELPRAGGRGVEARGLRHIDAISPAREVRRRRFACDAGSATSPRAGWSSGTRWRTGRTEDSWRPPRPASCRLAPTCDSERSRQRCAPRCGSCPIRSGSGFTTEAQRTQSNER